MIPTTVSIIEAETRSLQKGQDPARAEHYESIARVLDVSVGTVRSRLHRARALMRVQLRRLHHGSKTQ